MFMPFMKLLLQRGNRSSESTSRAKRIPRKLKEILDLARERGVPVRRKIVPSWTGWRRAKSIRASSRLPATSDVSPISRCCSSTEKPLIVVLDGVEDPHNLGAVIRTAEACGASGIVVPERHSAPLSATVVKASAGRLCLRAGRASEKSRQHDR